MNDLTPTEVKDLFTSIPRKMTDAAIVLPQIFGGRTTSAGFWRFFSYRDPSPGVSGWNTAWTTAWKLSASRVFAFGEDLFGNQLVLFFDQDNVFICNHENGVCHDTELDMADLIDTAVRHGVHWIDFYTDGSPSIARQFRDRVSWEQHLHWTQPLILGGGVSTDNITIVERFDHLKGHVRLWEQLSQTTLNYDVQPEEG